MLSFCLLKAKGVGFNSGNNSRTVPDETTEALFILSRRNYTLLKVKLFRSNYFFRQNILSGHPEELIYVFDINLNILET